MLLQSEVAVVVVSVVFIYLLTDLTRTQWGVEL